MDWNNDGQQDWQDDAFYNNVISPTSSNDSEEQNDFSGNSTQGGKSGVHPLLLLAMIVLLILELASCFD